MVSLCGATAMDATSRTVSLKVVIDGVTIFDAASKAGTQNSDNPIIAIGLNNSSEGSVALEPIVFNSSLSISVKSNIEETDKVRLSYVYRTV